MQHFVAGTAGHIDHGKSALVKALTGVDPDRLEEEQRRGMTIDLGFAHFDLPSGRRVGLIDVPGHERLIKNMLAGATGIDLVLLVVAADEGVMPQTREHLDILRFLPVKHGVVVLSKIDLVTDRDWLDLVKEDLRTLLAESRLAGAPMLEVSAKTGQGISDLVAAIDRLVDLVPTRQVDAPARLPIDRAFVIAGFGTIVTGTLWSGRIRPGEVLELLPRGRSVRVRGIQVHGQDATEALAGSRVALNLVGIEKEDVVRGDVLCTPAIFQPTSLIDVRVRLLRTAPALPHLARVRLYLGADEAIGRLVLLDRARLEPGEEILGQLRLETPIVAAARDPIVLRRFSPMLTVGGGEVVSAHPPRRRRTTDSVTEIADASAARLEDLVEQVVREATTAGITVEDLMRRLGATKVHIDAELKRLTEAGRLLQVRGRVFHDGVEHEVSAAIVAAIAEYHRNVPWRVGMPKEELKTRVFAAGDDRFYAHALDRVVREGGVDDLGAFLRLAGYVTTRDPAERAVREQLLRALQAGGYSPPSPEELAKSMEDRSAFTRMLQSAIDEGDVVEVAPGIIFHTAVLGEIKVATIAHIADTGSITVAGLRDRLGTSRKFALTVLEYFDTMKVTRRVGDARVLLEHPSGSRVHHRS